MFFFGVKGGLHSDLGDMKQCFTPEQWTAKLKLYPVYEI